MYVIMVWRFRHRYFFQYYFEQFQVYHGLRAFCFFILFFRSALLLCFSFPISYSRKVLLPLHPVFFFLCVSLYFSCTKDFLPLIWLYCIILPRYYYYWPERRGTPILMEWGLQLRLLMKAALVALLVDPN